MAYKILIGTNALPPRVGGLENITDDLALHLHQMGHLVTVILSSDYGLTQPARKFNTITLDSFLVGRLPTPKVSRSNARHLLKLRKENFDVAIIQTHLFVSNWIVAMLLKRKSKIIWISYGGGTVKHESKFISILIHIYEYLGWKILTFCSDLRFAQSEKTKIRFRNEGSQVKKINNCIPESLIHSELCKGKIEHVRKLLFVGRLVQDKNILELLNQVRKSIDILQEKYPLALEGLSLTLIGDGPLKERTLQFLENQFRIDWKVLELPDRRSVINEMLNHDLLIQFPLSEGQPGVSIEALTVGLPILTTPIDECLQSLDGVYTCDPISFAEKLSSIVANMHNFEVNVSINRQHLQSHHSVGSILDCIMESLC
jgi:glycosyltransferase involved in cell wall biosynthesis